MIPYDPAQPLISIHVPKTAGSSFRVVLDQWFGRDRVFYHYADEQAGMLPVKHQWQPGICIHGHFNRNRGIGVHDYYPQATQFITFLRDPFATRVSLYFYLKQTGATFPWGRGRARIDELCTTLPDFVRLAGDNRGSIPGQTFLQFMPEPITAADYRKRLFEKFLFVGITERMQADLDRLSEILGLPPVTAPTDNKSRYDEEISPALRRLHERLFHLEHAVYDEAKSRALG